MENPQARWETMTIVATPPVRSLMRLRQLTLDELIPQAHRLVALEPGDTTYRARCSCGFSEEGGSKRSARALFSAHKRRSVRG